MCEWEGLESVMAFSLAIPRPSATRGLGLFQRVAYLRGRGCVCVCEWVVVADQAGAIQATTDYVLLCRVAGVPYVHMRRGNHPTVGPFDLRHRAWQKSPIFVPQVSIPKMIGVGHIGKAESVWCVAEPTNEDAELMAVWRKGRQDTGHKA